MTIDDTCVWYKGSRGQQKTEGENSPGICGYKQNGCYDCDGQARCHLYTTQTTLLEIINNPTEHTWVKTRREE